MLDVLFGHIDFTHTDVAFDGIDALGYGADGKHTYAMDGRHSELAKYFSLKMLNDFFLRVWHGCHFQGGCKLYPMGARASAACLESEQ
jgi:hypothetical protein